MGFYVELKMKVKKREPGQKSGNASRPSCFYAV